MASRTKHYALTVNIGNRDYPGSIYWTAEVRLLTSTDRFPGRDTGGPGLGWGFVPVVWQLQSGGDACGSDFYAYDDPQIASGSIREVKATVPVAQRFASRFRDVGDRMGQPSKPGDVLLRLASLAKLDHVYLGDRRVRASVAAFELNESHATYRATHPVAARS